MKNGCNGLSLREHIPIDQPLACEIGNYQHCDHADKRARIFKQIQISRYPTAKHPAGYHRRTVDHQHRHSVQFEEPPPGIMGRAKKQDLCDPQSVGKLDGDKKQPVAFLVIVA